jgi:hypothetical protein
MSQGMRKTRMLLGDISSLIVRSLLRLGEVESV